MCSKKWAKPDLPGSTSFREPVCTGIWIETMFGKPVGTTMTFRPFGRVFSVAWKGRMSWDAAGVAGFLDGFAAVGFACCALARTVKKGEEDRGKGAETRHAGISFDSPEIPCDTLLESSEVSHAEAYRATGAKLRMDRLDDALEILDGAGPDYGGGLANHGPMAAEALFALEQVGRGRAVDGALPPEARRRARARQAGGARHDPGGARADAKVPGLARSLSARSFGRDRGSRPWTGGCTSSRRDSPGPPRTASSGPGMRRVRSPGTTRLGGEESSRGASLTGPRRIRHFPWKEIAPAHLTPEQALAHVPRLPDDVRRTGSIAQGLKLVATLPDFPGRDLARRRGLARVVRPRPRGGLRPRLPRGDEALGANDRARSRRDRPGRRGPSRAARVGADGGAPARLRVAGCRGHLRGVRKTARSRSRSERRARHERR